MIITVWLEPRVHWEIESDKASKMDWEMDHEVVYIQCQKYLWLYQTREGELIFFHFFVQWK